MGSKSERQASIDLAAGEVVLTFPGQLELDDIAIIRQWIGATFDVVENETRRTQGLPTEKKGETTP